ncbi:motility protein A [Desulfonatronum thioautotrophicum]|uniref:motility protein A n=1 Tax=Desulfonatronum thioautotrophicum TaxID=617001 RepID=UPI0005EBA0AF|nr:MotA/TolQ/ExbB proton channel family protein [Desulfonatronum thioautotrophicum]
MKSRTLITAAICFIGFIAVFFFSGQAHIYFNITALLVVVSGTLGSALLGSGPDGLRRAWRCVRGAYAEDNVAERTLVKELLRTAHLYKRTGRLTVNEDAPDYPPMQRGLEMLADGYTEAEIREVFQAEAKGFLQYREEMERIFRNMAIYAPSFGVAGSVIGLVGMLVGLGDTALILKSIPVTLVSTLYGIVLANFLLLPLAEKLRESTREELALRRIVLGAMVGMIRGTDFLKLQTLLNAITTKHDAQVDGLQVIREIKASLSRPVQPEEAGRLELAPLVKRP